MDRETALKILDQMRENYNLVAVQFSGTRKSSWEEIKPLAEYAKAGDSVLDLGCGNGRLLESFQSKGVKYSGIDNSDKLIEEARKKFHGENFTVFDGFKIPFDDNRFDLIFCIAVLHHIPSRQLRLEFLNEARRVLKPEGRIILTVWYFWSKNKFWQLFLRSIPKKLIGRSELDLFDIKQPWFSTAERYFHLFRKNELKRLFQKAGFIVEKVDIFKRGTENKNFLVVAKK